MTEKSVLDELRGRSNGDGMSERIALVVQGGGMRGIIPQVHQLRATSACQLFYNRKIQINGRSYVDGGVTDGVPVAHAVNLGATSVMAVLTRSPGFRRRETSTAYRLLGRTLARGQSAALKARIGREDVRFNDAMDLLEGITNPETPLRRSVVWPSDSATLVGRTTSDRGLLRACAEMGRADMQVALQQPWIEDLRSQTP